MEGRCQCGTIRFTTPLPKPLNVYICHCTECRHQSSSAFGISASFPVFDIHPAQPGDMAIYTRHTLSGAQLACYFCARCGSRLMHRDPGLTVVTVKGGCLEGLDMKNAMHIWTQEAIVAIPAGVESYPQEPPD